MKNYLVAILILLGSSAAHARLPSDTGLTSEASQVVTCKLSGYSTTPGGPQSTVYADVLANSAEEAMRKSVVTQSLSELGLNGDVRLLKIEMGNGRSIWAEKIECGNLQMQVAECCKAVCGTCIR